MGECSMARRRATRHLRHMHLPTIPQVVPLAGQADFWNAYALEAEVARALRRGARRLVIDLSAAVDIDSVMLRSLILAQKDARLREGRLVFACGHPTARRVFHLTGLDAVMDVVETREEALARLEA
jgi:anti-anti-sigma factor